MKNKYNSVYQNILYTLILTNEANKQIKKLIYDDYHTLGLQINIKKTGCAGFSYVFQKINKQNLDHTDIIFQNKNDIRLFIPYKIVSLINGSELDYIRDGLNYMFKFKNPNARYLCGCGTSFNV